MPYHITDAGHEIYISDWLTQPEIRAYAMAYDRGWCAECEVSPCECHECATDGSCTCDDCYNSYDEDQNEDGEVGLLPYNWSPPGGYPRYGTGPAYYGLEIEVTSDNDWDTLQFTRKELDTEHGEMGWLKSDGSVAGFELVTPPMSYEFAMAHWPWDLLPKLRTQGCSIHTEENGIHVHVSRAAFKSPAHVFRWMKLFYKNRVDICRIARRNSQEWAAFSSSHSASQFRHARKHGGKVANPYDDPEIYEVLAHARMARRRAAEQGVATRQATSYAERRQEQLLDIFDNDATTGNRYSAINTGNRATFEVRVFASTLSATKAQRCLQLVAASVEYTKTARGKESLRWSSFREWLQLNESTYPALAHGEYAAYVAENSVNV